MKDANRDDAGQQYHLIHESLIRIFVSKGFNDAEDLADEVMDRVGKRVPELRTTYVGDPARYFHGVARNVILERGRRREIPSEDPPELPLVPDRHSDEYECLLKCLKFLARDQQELIVDYYLYQGRDKIAQHRVMAAELGITDGALRQRAFHLRSRLEKCISNCVSIEDKTKTASRSINTGVLF